MRAYVGSATGTPVPGKPPRGALGLRLWPARVPFTSQHPRAGYFFGPGPPSRPGSHCKLESTPNGPRGWAGWGDRRLAAHMRPMPLRERGFWSPGGRARAAVARGWEGTDVDPELKPEFRARSVKYKESHI